MLQNDNDTWKYLPLDGRCPQFIYQEAGRRAKFTENPENPLFELESFCEQSNNRNLLLMPPCSDVTYKKAKECFEKVVIVDCRRSRLDLFLNEVDCSAQYLFIESEQHFRNASSSSIYKELASGEMSVYLPIRYKRIDSELASYLGGQLLSVQKEFSSYAVHRSLNGWHKNLNALLNIQLIDKHLNSFPNINKKAVVIVGAGPSLDTTVDSLAKYQDRSIIIASDGSLKTLLKNKIVPDFIVSCDGGILTWRFIAGHEGQLKSAPLFIDQEANHYLLKNYPGPVILTRSSSAAAWSQTFNEQFPLLEAGRCVGHMAFNLAVALNAGKIVMTGFDLAYKNDRFHPVDMPVPYFHEMDAPSVTTVEAVDGTLLKTDLSMVIYLRDFEWMIKCTSIPVYDCTEGGARKEGAIVDDLKTVLQKCQKKTLPTLNQSIISNEAKSKLVKFLSYVEKGELCELGRMLVDSFCSYLVQNSSKIPSADKKDDFNSSFDLLKAVLKKSSSLGNRKILLDSGETPDAVMTWALDENVEILTDYSFSDLVNYLKVNGVGTVYTVDNNVIPDLRLLTGSNFIEIKTNIDKTYHERSNWIDSYSVLAMPEVYGFWREALPEDVSLTVAEFYQQKTKVS